MCWSRKFVSGGTGAFLAAPSPVSGTASFRNSKGSVVLESQVSNVESRVFLLPPDRYVVTWESENRLWETELDLRLSGPTDDWRLFDSRGKTIATATVTEPGLNYRLNFRCAKAGVRGYRVFLYRRLRPVPGGEAVHYEYVQAENTRFVHFPAGVTEIAGIADLEGLPAGNYRMEIYFYEGETVFSGGGANFRLVGNHAPPTFDEQTRKKILAVAPPSFYHVRGDSALAAAFMQAAGENADELFEAESALRWQYGPPDSVGRSGELRYYKYRAVFPKSGSDYPEPPRLTTGL